MTHKRTRNNEQRKKCLFFIRCFRIQIQKQGEYLVLAVLHYTLIQTCTYNCNMNKNMSLPCRLVWNEEWKLKENALKDEQEKREERTKRIETIVLEQSCSGKQCQQYIKLPAIHTTNEIFYSLHAVNSPPCNRLFCTIQLRLERIYSICNQTNSIH